MTPTDLPAALAEAIRASERDERQFFRIESLEHAVSVFEAAEPELAAAQTLVAMGVVTRFVEEALAESEREAARLLAVRCLASVHRYLSGDRAPRTLTEHYLPPWMAEAARAA